LRDRLAAVGGLRLSLDELTRFCHWGSKATPKVASSRKPSAPLLGGAMLVAALVVHRSI
jgi:hypothetical protein